MVSDYRTSFVGNDVIPNQGAKGDFNGDGVPDLIWVSDISSSSLTYPSPIPIFLGQTSSDTRFSASAPVINESTTYPEAFFAMYIDVADVNSDGIDDIFVIEQTERPALDGQFYPFRGGPQYAYVSNGPMNYTRLSVAEGDHNAHGYGFITSADSIFRIILNTPWSADTTAAGTTTIISEYDIASNSFNPQYLNRSSEYHLIQNENFEPQNSYFYQFSLDVNADGNDDIVSMSNWTGDNGFYLNDGHGGFHHHAFFDDNLRQQISMEEVAIGDFNSDGYHDFVGLFIDRTNGETHLNKSLRIFINQDGETFLDETNVWLGSSFENIDSSYGYLDSYDFNADGYTDFAWNHYASEYSFSTNLLDLFISDGTQFITERYTDVVGPRQIPFSEDSFIADGKIFRFSSGVSVAVDEPTTIAPARIPGDSSNYTVFRSGDVRKFLASDIDFWLADDMARVAFTDGMIAFDLSGSAGLTAKTLSAVIGEDGLSNKEYVGIGLQLFDAGQSLASVCELALTAVGATTNEAVVNLLYTNLYGEAPTADVAQPFIDALNNGGFTKGSLAAAAAELTDDLGVIDLVGLAETGIEYV